MSAPTCRACGALLGQTIVDLGRQPLANAYRDPDDATPELTYPLHARFCIECFLAQVDNVVPPDEIFSDYAYFSSYSTTWVEHAERFVELAIERFDLKSSSFVVEIASNDGYLLQHVVSRGIRALGVEPAANIAEVANGIGVPTESSFFGKMTAVDIVQRHGLADLIVANNVLAHVPDLNDFVAGMRELLAAEGVISIEVPHLLRLVEDVQFDTIYHEHFSYFSLLAISAVMARHDLAVFDVEELSTHGGSLRVLVAVTSSGRTITDRVEGVLEAERLASLDKPIGFQTFRERVELCRDALRRYLEAQAQQERTVVAYGAAAKGNTLLNYAGISSSLIAYVVDRNPHKQGKLMPGSRLEIRSVDCLRDDKPDIVLILPWNLRTEIVDQLHDVRDWGGRFAVAVPTMREL